MTGDPCALKYPGRLFIGGKWVSADTDKVVNVYASHDETVVYQVGEANEKDLAQAVVAARQAFDYGPWPRLSHRERAAWMRKIATGLERRADEFARIWTLESGVLFKLSLERIAKTLAAPFHYSNDGR